MLFHQPYCCLDDQIQPAESGTGISYPNLDEPPPPSYDAAAAPSDGSGVGQLIDLGSDITSGPPVQSEGGGGGDIVSQLAELGITTQPSSQPQQQSDEFDMFARSRTAYGTDQ